MHRGTPLGAFGIVGSGGALIFLAPRLRSLASLRPSYPAIGNMLHPKGKEGLSRLHKIATGIPSLAAKAVVYSIMNDYLYTRSPGFCRYLSERTADLDMRRIAE